MTTGPHLLNLPPPPADTPSEFGPGTPNSSISQLSTVAIKEGERGKIHTCSHTHNASSSSDSSTNTLDAERADRISRLAGLERVAALRGAHQQALSLNPQAQQQGYFDGAGNIHKSTVGSASATGSIGGSMPDSADKMSEDADEKGSSTGFSEDGNGSLVDFGEAVSSNQSGTTTATEKPGLWTSLPSVQRRLGSEASDSLMDGLEGNSGMSGGEEQAEKIIGETMRAERH